MRKDATDKQRGNRDAKARSLANLKPFRKGQSGNPKGRPKGISLSEAYRRVLAEVDESDPQRRTFAEILAEQMIGKAKRGDVQAAREIADRVEGKPRQRLEISEQELDRQIEEALRVLAAQADE